jgi:tetratricopeptide (TPR) repeat protein
MRLPALLCCLGLSLPPAESRASGVEELLAQWRVSEAVQALQRLKRSRAADAEILVAESYVLLHQGQYERAAKVLQQALQRTAHAPRRWRTLLKLIESTAETVRGHVEHRSAGGHFRFRVPRGRDELLVPFAAATLEALRERLEHDLGYAPPDTILVEVYGRAEDLARVSTLTREDIERTGTVALCKYNRLMIVSPRALLRGYAWLDTLAHEYVHLIVGRLSHNATPVWLQEGLAKHFEGRWRLDAQTRVDLAPAQEHLLSQALRGKRRMIRWEEMHPSMAKLPSQLDAALAFAQAQTAVALIAGRGGPPALRGLIEALRDGQSGWAAVEKVTGLPRKRFLRAYRKHLRGLNLRRLPGLIPQERRFGKPPSKDQQLAQIRQRKAREFFRLADMLRQRRSVRAAIVEYEKARALAGQRDALIANALARAHLQSGSPDQALRVLMPVIEYYPELPGPRATMGTAYLRGGNRQAAARHFTVALRVNPFNPEVHCGLAKSLTAAKLAQRHAAICRQLAP